jgi:phage baseplate assembly protein gpV
MKPMNGVVEGIVTAVKEGEVKVKYPWLHEDEGEEKESDWIRIATSMAGKDKGTFFMPEIDDEVLIAFTHGKFNSPYIVGFLWNGKDKTPEKNTKKRVIKTKSGHIVEFDDNSGVEKITIKSQGKHKVELDDTSPGKINIESKGKHKITLDDTIPGNITIESQGKNKVVLNDTPPGSITISTGIPGSSISVNTSTGMVMIDCLNAIVMAKTNVTVQAPQTIFTGIVQTQLLQSQAVISAAYNPLVPGNLFGL